MGIDRSEGKRTSCFGCTIQYSETAVCGVVQTCRTEARIALAPASNAHDGFAASPANDQGRQLACRRQKIEDGNWEIGATKLGGIINR
jgi:hypothetical protein